MPGVYRGAGIGCAGWGRRHPAAPAPIAGMHSRIVERGVPLYFDSHHWGLAGAKAALAAAPRRSRGRGVTRIGIIGIDGRMGQALVTAIAAAGHDLAGGTNRRGDLAALAARSDVLVDFSAPAALEANLDAAVAAQTAIVVGTTGLAERDHWLCDAAAERIAVLQTENTSVGVTLLAHLVREAASRLDQDWDIEIVETHHRMKADAPSGTALLLGEAAAQGRGIALAAHSARGRNGITGPRTPGDIGFAALRGGTVAGDHGVTFLGESERLILSHQAENRTIFAQGAVRAAGWLAGKPPGRYTMGGVLAL